LGAHHRVISQTIALIVVVVREEDRDIELVIDQIVNGIVEVARQQLVAIIDLHHGALTVVIRFEC
jgi:hypothetical protein